MLVTTVLALQPQLCSFLKEHFGYMESLQDVIRVLGQIFPVSAANAINSFYRNCLESVLLLLMFLMVLMSCLLGVLSLLCYGG